MSVMLKRSDKNKSIPQECPYGCCTPIHGKNVKHIRRSLRSSQKNQIRKEIRDELAR